MNFPLGIGLLLLGALMNGNFALPMKYARRWNWEIIWSVYTVAALILLPWLATLVSIPNFGSIYSSCTAAEILIPVAFGLGWGVAQVLYGLGVSMLGISLGNSIIVGIAATLGSGIPLVVLHREKVLEREGLSILAGVFIMLWGIYHCGLAGRARGMQGTQSGAGRTPPRRYALALFVCIVCGIVAPMMTLALAFGTGVMNRAVAMGVSATKATYVLWALVLPSGATISVLYCLYLMNRNNSWRQFRLAGTSVYWLLALTMAVLWVGGVLLYGFSTVYLGTLGIPIAQAIFVIFVILGANATGFLTGEWRGIAGAPLRHLAAGVALLALACAVIAVGNR